MFQHLWPPQLLVEGDLLRQQEVGLLPLLLCSQPGNKEDHFLGGDLDCDVDNCDVLDDHLDDHSHDDDNDLAAKPAWLGPWVFRSGTLCHEHEIWLLCGDPTNYPVSAFKLININNVHPIQTLQLDIPD